MKGFPGEEPQMAGLRSRVPRKGSGPGSRVPGEEFEVPGPKYGSRVQLFWYAEMQLGYQKSEQNIVKRETKV